MDALATADIGHDDGGGTATDVLDRLLQAAARVTAERSRQLRTLGLSPSAFAVLAELSGADPGGLQPCDLADLLSVTRPSVCGLIDGLEVKGLVARGPHHRDGRRVLVRLTRDGAQVLDGHRARYEERQHALVAALSREDQRLLGDLVDRIGT